MKTKSRNGFTARTTTAELKKMVKREEQDRFGLREPGQPSAAATELYCRQMESDFSPEERRLIRSHLGLPEQEIE